MVSNTSGTFTFGGNRYNMNGTVTALWDNTAYSTDSTYNTALRTQILKEGRSRARSLAKGLSDARYKGRIERKGAIITVGNLIKLTNLKTGQNQELIRVTDVRDTINKNGWFTSLELEQDQKAIIAGDTT